MYKHVSRTLDITTLNETTIRRKLKRVLINLLGFFSFEPQIHYERPPFSIYGQTFSKSYLKHLFMSLLQYLQSCPLVSIFKTCFTFSSSRAALSFLELCISLKCFRISQLFVDADQLRSVQVHHSQHVPRYVQQGECVRNEVFFNILFCRGPGIFFLILELEKFLNLYWGKLTHQ